MSWFALTEGEPKLSEIESDSIVQLGLAVLRVSFVVLLFIT